MDRRPERIGATRRAERGGLQVGGQCSDGMLRTVRSRCLVKSRGRPDLAGRSLGWRRADSFVPCRPVGLTGHLFLARRVTQHTHQSQRNPGWQSNVNGRLAPGATGRTDWPLVGASPARTAGTRSTGSTTRTLRRCAGSSPSAARSARAGSRERAAAIRARSRALSSARTSLRYCRTSRRARTSAGNAASGPAVARAETGSRQRPASSPRHGGCSPGKDA